MLLLILSAPLLVSVCQLLQQQYIQHQVKEQLETAALETIIIPAAQLQWVEKDRELLVRGELFDVKEITLCNGNYIVNGLFDSKETAIAKKIEQAAGNQHKSGDTKTALQFLLLMIFSNSAQNIALDAPLVIFNKKTTHFSQAACNAFISIPTPPPDKA